ncbi:sterol desaturase family protein [Tenacibaculum maritimum]|uniref:sterol desaturase family protein n=2 Tax=Tenacibaculum maritimum TaxID=107401 RepID=UPI0010A59C3B|nr:sterol desaturase family protein [Tenacibaculum maritimum]MCD9582505.1 sterol desaturase family protein [Tenacibaculum maritimum]MCD9584177.1 sterol desaturase family protein [Tenacibaculum maritimum]MCD9619969.1 sterol desaturase family protein [Tenacibaculum maritimum]MCD9627422.1 sterol desaturase family protein [Tenacibaculum maritimum]MCD9629474.1 sterol desaturase family protein [Tenacibaculum maritimum]
MGIQLLFEQLESKLAFIFLFSVVLEWVILVINNKINSNKSGFVNLLSYFVELLPYFILDVFFFGIMLWLYNYRLFDLGTSWYVWVLCYVLYDLLFYIIHYLGHRVRFFWCIHGVHHTAEEMKMTVAVRGSFLGFLLTPHNTIWLPLLGFDPFMVLIVDGIAKIYGLFEHINEHFISSKNSWIENIFVTPSVHRVHHSKNHVYLDRNYGETFSIWDHLFGTFQTEIKEEKPLYGMMDDKIDGKNLWQIQTVLWKELWYDIKTAPTFKDKINYLIKPPGWNHIDGGKLAEEFRNEAKQKITSKTS